MLEVILPAIVMIAIMIGFSFFIFKNVDTENISVVYKRKDGRYGIIDAN